jgi:hypothetical protein
LNVMMLILSCEGNSKSKGNFSFSLLFRKTQEQV